MLNINGTLMRICHPASWRGSGLITTPYPGLTPWAMILSPLRAQVSARLRLAQFQFSDFLEVPYSLFTIHYSLQLCWNHPVPAMFDLVLNSLFASIPAPHRLCRQGFRPPRPLVRFTMTPEPVLSFQLFVRSANSAVSDEGLCLILSCPL